MHRFKVKALILALGALVLVVSNSAHAYSVTWTFEDAYFKDETSLTGSFQYDADIGGQAGFSAVNLVTQDGRRIGGTTYTDVTWLSGDYGLSAVSLGQYIGVVLAAAMTNAGGSIDVIPVISTEGTFRQIFGISFPIPKRYLVAGRIVSGGGTVQLAEPATLVLFIIGLMAIGARRRTIG